MKHVGDGDINCNWCAWNDPQGLCKEAGRVGNERSSRNHPNYSLVKICKNTEKSPEDLQRLAVAQTSVEKPSANADVKNLHKDEKVKNNNNSQQKKKKETKKKTS